MCHGFKNKICFKNNIFTNVKETLNITINNKETKKIIKGIYGTQAIAKY